MKKSLLALAVLGAFASAAQAQVTIGGIYDIGFKHVNKESNAGDKKSINGSNSSTSQLVFAGKEDLGGGLTAGFKLENDFTAGSNSSTFLNSENFVSLGGGFGEIRLGNNNAAMLYTQSASQPFGTAMGSGYSADFGRLSGYGVNGSGAGTSTAISTTTSGTTTDATTGSRIIRTNSSAYYYTPSLSGFKASVGYAAKNDNSTANSVNTLGMLEFGATYSNGPLNLALTQYESKSGANAVLDGTASLAINSNAKLTQRMLAGNYTFGPATVYAGYTTSKLEALGADVSDAKSWNIAGKYQVTPVIALMANYVRVSDDTIRAVDRSLAALGADYALSKRTVAYARVEKYDTDRSGATLGDNTQYALGLRHTF